MKIDTERELYHIECAGGFTCLGFDVLLNRSNAVARWLREQGREVANIPATLRGTPQAYGLYRSIFDAGRACHVATGKRCDAELIPELVGLETQRVEVVDKHGERRRFYVGKSLGWLPCHLEIKQRNSSGGPAVMGAPFKFIRVLGAQR